MKICYYCQHVLGIGHFHRSLEICRALGGRHQVTMILGGPEVAINEPSLSAVQLPGLKMDAEFSRLTPCDELPLDTVKDLRREQLLSLIDTLQPDCVVLELYPFGRKNFRFELDPLLAKLAGTPCKVFCSLRDILVEKKQGRDRFELRAAETLNRYFDGLLIHADPDFVTLDETFSRTDLLETDIHYTGFISPTPVPNAREHIRKKLNLKDSAPLIVASIGSGSVGFELMYATVQAVKNLHDEALMLQLFTGPYLPEPQYRELLRHEDSHIQVNRFSNRFVDWLAAADLSVSMAGYNTCMNVLASGVPALMYPFDQNREQRMRVSKFTSGAQIRLLEPADLEPLPLAQCLTAMLKKERSIPDIKLDGAIRTAAIIEDLASR